jgi:phage terminase large subunit-like protein
MTRLSKELIASLPQSAIAQLNDLAVDIGYSWDIQARDKQRLPPGDWITWLILAGRGFGKTRTGAETMRIWARNYPIMHMVGATASDARDIMVEGESGILAISPKHERPTYEPTKRKLTWPNGAKALVYSAAEPDRLRGPQCYKAWADELASWQYPEAWDQLNFGLRLGTNPQVIVTTTPRPTKIIRQLFKDTTTHVTQGTTYENRDNLADAFFHHVITQYEGTRLGRQELQAEILEDVEGALWKMALIDDNRVKDHPDLKRVVIAVDPAATSKKDSDKTGIVVCGVGPDDHGYILEDKSGIYSPNEWARVIIGLYDKHKADRVVAEVNNGGEMVGTLLKNAAPNISYKSVHASRGKAIRAEPVVSLYEQGKVHHVGVLGELEAEMCGWAPDLGLPSPDRLDALVWGLTDLMLNNKNIFFI